MLIPSSDSKFVPAELTGFVGEVRRFAVVAFRLRDFKIPLLNRVVELAIHTERPPSWRPFIDASGRGERIRTSDLSVPNRAHYQAVLRPEEVRHSKRRVRDGQVSLEAA